MNESEEIIRRLESIDRRLEQANENNLNWRKDENDADKGMESKISAIDAKLDAKLDSLTNLVGRVVFALIAIIAADVGVRVIASPLWIDLFVFATIAGLTFISLESLRVKRYFKMNSALSFLAFIISAIELAERNITSSYGINFLPAIFFGFAIIFWAISTWIEDIKGTKGFLPSRKEEDHASTDTS